MPLPEFNATGDLPSGVHHSTLAETVQRFGAPGGQRDACTRRLAHIFELARRTGCLNRFVIFGSYVTGKPDPNDVDVVLVMNDTFRLEGCPVESRGLFEHALAQARYGASIFWMRPAMLMGETVEDFIDCWQIKRDGAKRGIVALTP